MALHQKMDKYIPDQYLPTYPSPNSTTVSWQQVKVNVGLGEG